MSDSGNAWRIFNACRRCHYQKSHEPILIFSEHRGPRIIVYPDGRCYKRIDSSYCWGIGVCGDRRCFKVQRGEETESSILGKYPCKWEKF